MKYSREQLSSTFVHESKSGLQPLWKMFILTDMKISTRLLTVVSILTSVVGLNAQVVTPNPAPTIITTAPYTISKPGFYQLGADLTLNSTTGNIITIAASNVTLDFGGHYISGPVNAASQVIGVYASEQGNLTIQNGTVAFCEVGIDLAGNGTANSININQRVSDMLISYCYYIGIDSYRANYSQYNDNRISFIGGSTLGDVSSSYGILDQSSQGNQAIGNSITNVTSANQGAYGIVSSGTLAASNNSVSNVTCTYSGGGANAFGIFNTVFSVGNTVRNCYDGIAGGKYQNNLSSGCTYPFSGGTDAGGNN